MAGLSFDDIIMGLRDRLPAPPQPAPISERGDGETGGRVDCLPVGPGEVTFNRVIIDSRLAQPGDLFVAMPGERTDGHAHVGDAIARGARGAIVARPVGLSPALAAGEAPPVLFLVDDTQRALQDLAAAWRLKLGTRTVGITGTVGKTSTKDLIAAVLGQRYRVLKNEGNLNNEIGLPLTLLRLEPGHERAVIEMGFYTVGEIAYLATIARPAIGVVTNVGPAHAERAGGIEQIARGKGELVESLPADGLAILNGDDPRVRPMQTRTRAQLVLYGLDPGFDVWADAVESRGIEGIRLRIHYQGRTGTMSLPLYGRHTVHNALAAAAVGLVEGLGWDEIEAGLRAAATHQRLVVRSGLAGSTVIDDAYNANPLSMLAALGLLAELPGRKIAVLGDMKELGPYEREGHEQVGRRAAEVADHLVVVGVLGRLIGEAALAAGSQQVYFAGTNQEAAAYLRDRLGSDDAVLVKGSRSMRMEEIVAAIGLEACSAT